MSETRYPTEVLDDDEDDGTMVESLKDLTEAVVGHRIVSVYRAGSLTYLTLDNGKRVSLAGRGDCCAFTELEAFLLHPERVDHIITGVGTTGEYTTWHIYADMGDVLELTVGWSCGNPFYYAYGFTIEVEDGDMEQALPAGPASVKGMSERVITDQMVAGALLRRSVRASLDSANIGYREHRGLLDSIFVVTATESQWRVIRRWADGVNAGA